MNIFVSSLNFKVRNEDLINLFEQYGEVLSAKVLTDKFSGKSRGFGFVEMKNDEAGQRAISELNEKDFEGRKIKVSVAKPKTQNLGLNRGATVQKGVKSKPKQVKSKHSGIIGEIDQFVDRREETGKIPPSKFKKKNIWVTLFRGGRPESNHSKF
jgi:RNA recognition motif-containing protein